MEISPFDCRRVKIHQLNSNFRWRKTKYDSSSACRHRYSTSTIEYAYVWLFDGCFTFQALSRILWRIHCRVHTLFIPQFYDEKNTWWWKTEPLKNERSCHDLFLLWWMTYLRQEIFFSYWGLRWGGADFLQPCTKEDLSDPRSSSVHVGVLLSSGPKYGNPGSGTLACGADLVKHDYSLKSAGQRSGSGVKVG